MSLLFALIYVAASSNPQGSSSKHKPVCFSHEFWENFTPKKSLTQGKDVEEFEDKLKLKKHIREITSADPTLKSYEVEFIHINNGDIQHKLIDSLKTFLKPDSKGVVVKPNCGNCSKGVFMIKKSESDEFWKLYTLKGSKENFYQLEGNVDQIGNKILDMIQKDKNLKKMNWMLEKIVSYKTKTLTPELKISWCGGAPIIATFHLNDDDYVAWCNDGSKWNWGRLNKKVWEELNMSQSNAQEKEKMFKEILNLIENVAPKFVQGVALLNEKAYYKKTYTQLPRTDFMLGDNGWKLNEIQAWGRYPMTVFTDVAESGVKSIWYKGSEYRQKCFPNISKRRNYRV